MESSSFVIVAFAGAVHVVPGVVVVEEGWADGVAGDGWGTDYRGIGSQEDGGDDEGGDHSREDGSRDFERGCRGQCMYKG